MRAIAKAKKHACPAAAVHLNFDNLLMICKSCVGWLSYMLWCRYFDSFCFHFSFSFLNFFVAFAFIAVVVVVVGIVSLLNELKYDFYF